MIKKAYHKTRLFIEEAAARAFVGIAMLIFRFAVWLDYMRSRRR